MKHFLLGGTVQCEGRGSPDRAFLSPGSRVRVRKGMWLAGEGGAWLNTSSSRFRVIVSGGGNWWRVGTGRARPLSAPLSRKAVMEAGCLGAPRVDIHGRR